MDKGFKYFLITFVVAAISLSSLFAYYIIDENDEQRVRQRIVKELSIQKDWHRCEVVGKTKIIDYIDLFKKKELELSSLKMKFDNCKDSERKGIVTQMEELVNKMGLLLTEINLISTYGYSKPVKSLESLDTYIVDVTYMDGDGRKSYYKELVVQDRDNDKNLYVLTDLVEEFSSLYENSLIYLDNIDKNTNGQKSFD